MPQVIDAGVANKSVSATFMKLVSVHHEMDNNDFEDVVKFLEEHLDEIINDVHKLDKLYLDDGEVCLFLLWMKGGQNVSEVETERKSEKSYNMRENIFCV